MAILSTPVVAATVNALVTKTRRMLGDTSTSSAMQRWSDSDVRAALDDTIAQLYTEMASGDPTPHLTSDDLTYTADQERVVLTTGREGYSIYRVEDVTTSGFPVHLEYLNLSDGNTYSDTYGWFLEGNNIGLKPIPSTARTLRIWSLRPFVPVSTAATPSTDQHNLMTNYEELIALGTAIRLQETDDEVSPSRLLRFEQLWAQFQKTLDRYRGPVYVRSTRKVYGRSY